MARQFWLSERIIRELCVVFLVDDTGDRWKLYVDDEHHKWKMDQTEDVPSPGTVDGDAEFRYPTVDLLKDYPVAGLPIQAFVERDTGVAAEARVNFEGGTSLVFTYEYATEKSSCALVTG